MYRYSIAPITHRILLLLRRVKMGTTAAAPIEVDEVPLEQVPPVPSNLQTSSKELQFGSDHEESKDENYACSCQCSVCKVSLTSSLSASTLFTAHAHPYLSVPACGRCSERALEAEKIVLQGGDHSSNKDNVTENSICSLCARDDEEVEEFFLCDNCPRSVCRECVVTLYSNGSEATDLEASESLVSDLAVSDSDWHCFRCEIEEGENAEPFTLSQWRLSLENVMNASRQNEIDDDENEAKIFIEKLTMLEDAKIEAAHFLEDKQIENQKTFITQEIQDNGEIGSSIENSVEQEISLYVKQWEEHFERIEADIPLIQELLEENGVPVESFYAERSKNLSQNVSVEEEIKDQIARKYADDALNRVPTIERQVYANHDSEVYELDVEDIDSNDIFDISKDTDAMEISTRVTLEKGQHKTAESFQRIYRKALDSENKILSSKTPKRKYESVDKKCEQQYYARSKSVLSEHLVSILILKQQVKKSKKSRLNGSQKTIRTQTGLESRFNSKGGEKKSGGQSERSHTQETGKTQAGSLQQDKRTKNISMHPPEKKATTPRRAVIPIPVHEKEHIQFKPISPPIKKIRRSIQFQNSDIVLNSNDCDPITVVKQLAIQLKPHQIEGVKFMFENICPSLSSRSSDAPIGNDDVRGCILAHNMGLGKTLQAITLLHTLFTNPIIQNLELFKTALICVPVNTLVNWIDEFDLWIGSKLDIPRFKYQSIAKVNSSSQIDCFRRWRRDGGVMIMSIDSFKNITADLGRTPSDPLYDPNLNEARRALLEPDIVFIDEAHIPLKNEKTKRFKAFESMKTKRRIALTGTPIQNNLMEYYSMTTWVQPNCFESRKYFQTKFLEPIVEGSCSDSTLEVKASQRRATEELHNILDHFVQRRSSELLLNDLPPMQQAVIVIRSSRVQQRLHKLCPKRKFLEWYGMMRPVFNHPGCLLMKGRHSSLDEDIEDYLGHPTNQSNTLWWKPILDKVSDLKRIKYGAKMLVLLQILAHADKLNEKVVVFSQCLKTLDFIEDILHHEDWSKVAPAIKDVIGDKVIGNWSRNQDYIRIDGSNSASERGSLVSSFKNTDALKAFLISTKAGGVGINLTSANRIVLMDSGFNPSIEAQAVYRCYRYGQTKPVYVHRLVAEGMEEKVYKRQVAKIGLSARVIDKENPERNFTQAELDAITNASLWVCCDKCNKWRMLPPDAEVDLEKEWYCSMNIHDEARSKCDAQERDEQWYIKYKKQHDPNWSGEAAIENVRASEKQQLEKKLRRQDVILDKILDDYDGPMISRFFFHESLLLEAEIDDEEENALKEAKARSETVSSEFLPLTVIGDFQQIDLSNGISGLPQTEAGEKKENTVKASTPSKAVHSGILLNPHMSITSQVDESNVVHVAPQMTTNERENDVKANSLSEPNSSENLTYPISGITPQISQSNTVSAVPQMTNNLPSTFEGYVKELKRNMSTRNPDYRAAGVIATPGINANLSNSVYASKYTKDPRFFSGVVNHPLIPLASYYLFLQNLNHEIANNRIESSQPTQLSYPVASLEQSALPVLLSASINQGTAVDHGNVAMQSKGKQFSEIVGKARVATYTETANISHTYKAHHTTVTKTMNPQTNSRTKDCTISNESADDCSKEDTLSKTSNITSIEMVGGAQIDRSTETSLEAESDRTKHHLHTGTASGIDEIGKGLQSINQCDKHGAIGQQLHINEISTRVSSTVANSQLTNAAGMALVKSKTVSPICAMTAPRCSGESSLSENVTSQLRSTSTSSGLTNGTSVPSSPKTPFKRTSAPQLSSAEAIENLQQSVQPSSSVTPLVKETIANYQNTALQNETKSKKVGSTKPTPLRKIGNTTNQIAITNHQDRDLKSNCTNRDENEDLSFDLSKKKCILSLSLEKFLISEFLDCILPPSSKYVPISSSISAFLMKEYEQVVQDELLPTDPENQTLLNIQPGIFSSHPHNEDFSETGFPLHGRKVSKYKELPLKGNKKYAVSEKYPNHEKNHDLFIPKKRLLLPSDAISRNVPYRKRNRASFELGPLNNMDGRNSDGERNSHKSSHHRSTKRPVLPFNALQKQKDSNFGYARTSNTISLEPEQQNKRRFLEHNTHGKKFIRRTGRVLKTVDDDTCSELDL